MQKPAIGILSMHRVINYGSFLQAYALKKLIERIDNRSVEFLDIIPGKPVKGHTFTGSLRFKTRLKNGMKTIFKGELIRKYRNKKFYNEIARTIKNNWPLLGLKEDADLASQKEKGYDNVIIGSDEVFNCCQGAPWGLTPQLYGMVSNTTHVSSYAGSFGQTTLPQIKNLKLDSIIVPALLNLEYISVRDQNSEDIILKLTGNRPQRHLDPVLIYGYKEELAMMKEKPLKDEYILVYSYPERIKAKEEINLIREYAKEKECKIVSLFARYDWCDVSVIPENVMDVLAWFKYADYIFTDTFHGSIFSIITHSSFYTLCRDTNYNKLKSLLGAFGLEDRLIWGVKENMKIGKEKEIIYCHVEEILDSERKRSNLYLTKCLRSND